mmetsp:Transcript_29377/g.80638  ORF Transcript_29377/g.80638 Transcript_29377/m.80638 type:complete len:221 (+) Transcript_29377:380-1042(+)
MPSAIEKRKGWLAMHRNAGTAATGSSHEMWAASADMLTPRYMSTNAEAHGGKEATTCASGRPTSRVSAPLTHALKPVLAPSRMAAAEVPLTTIGDTPHSAAAAVEAPIATNMPAPPSASPDSGWTRPAILARPKMQPMASNTSIIVMATTCDQNALVPSTANEGGWKSGRRKGDRASAGQPLTNVHCTRVSAAMLISTPPLTLQEFSIVSSTRPRNVSQI